MSWYDKVRSSSYGAWMDPLGAVLDVRDRWGHEEIAGYILTDDIEAYKETNKSDFLMVKGWVRITYRPELNIESKKLNSVQAQKLYEMIKSRRPDRVGLTLYDKNIYRLVSVEEALEILSDYF